MIPYLFNLFAYLVLFCVLPIRRSHVIIFTLLCILTAFYLRVILILDSDLVIYHTNIIVMNIHNRQFFLYGSFYVEKLITVMTSFLLFIVRHIIVPLMHLF